MKIQSDLSSEHLTQTIRELMEEQYDLGEVTRIKEVLGGYCNKSFAVWMSRNDCIHRHFLRLYQPNAIESEILFEHALLSYLRSNGFTLAADILACRNGETLVNTPAPESHQGSKALWTLFEFLEGEDKYSWTETNLTDKEFSAAACVLAHLHYSSHGFTKPPNADRVQPRIMELVPAFKQTFSLFLEQAEDRRCDRLFKDNFESIIHGIDDAIAFGDKFQGMAELPIHCDYHPGNLKYRDEACVGIFDFDWSKIDYRLFDVALALVYFTSIWNGQTTGLRPDKFSLFLKSYNQACRQYDNIDPLTAQEQTLLVPMLSIANLYVLNWDLVDFYNMSEPDDDEYYRFIDHNIGLMHWLESHKDDLETNG